MYCSAHIASLRSISPGLGSPTGTEQLAMASQPMPTGPRSLPIPTLISFNCCIFASTPSSEAHLAFLKKILSSHLLSPATFVLTALNSAGFHRLLSIRSQAVSLIICLQFFITTLILWSLVERSSPCLWAYRLQSNIQHLIKLFSSKKDQRDHSSQNSLHSPNVTILLLRTDTTKGNRSYNIWMTDQRELKDPGSVEDDLLQMGTALIPSLPFNNISSAYLVPSTVCVPELSLACDSTVCFRTLDE